MYIVKYFKLYFVEFQFIYFICGIVEFYISIIQLLVDFDS